MNSNKINMWNWVSDELNSTFTGQGMLAIYLKDGRLVESGPLLANIWNVTSGQVEFTFPTEGLAFEELSNGLLVTGATNMKLNFWNISTRSLVKTLNFSTSQTFLRQLKNGNYLASGDWVGTISIIDTSNYTTIITLTGHGERITGIEELPGGLIVTSSLDFTVKLWQLNSSNFLDSRDPLGDNIYSMQVISESSIVVGGYKNSLEFLTIDKILNKFTPNRSDFLSSTIVFDIKVTNTDLIMASLNDGSIRLYNKTTLDYIRSVRLSSSGDIANFIAIPRNIS